MRLFKLLSIAALAVIAVLGGFVVAAVIAAATVAAWLARRFLFKGVSVSPPPRGRASSASEGPGSDVIDVTATEVRASSREP